MALLKKSFLLQLIHWLHRRIRKMLVLTRYIDESIIINDNIKITVLDIQGNQVRLGIEAPIDVDVHREEIYEKIQAKLSKQRD